MYIPIGETCTIENAAGAFITIQAVECSEHCSGCHFFDVDEYGDEICSRLDMFHPNNSPDCDSNSRHDSKSVIFIKAVAETAVISTKKMPALIEIVGSMIKAETNKKTHCIVDENCVKYLYWWEIDQADLQQVVTRAAIFNGTDPISGKKFRVQEYVPDTYFFVWLDGAAQTFTGSREECSERYCQLVSAGKQILVGLTKINK